jgi:hypothetical protein
MLHWQQIIGLFHKCIAPANLRSEVAILFVMLCETLLFFSFFINPEIDDGSPGKGRCRGEVDQSEDIGPDYANLTSSKLFSFRLRDGA